VEPRDMGPAFAAFIQERFKWSTTQMHGLRKTTAKPIPAPTEHHGRGEAKCGGSGETRFRKPGGGGAIRQAHGMVVQEGARHGSRHQQPGTPFQNGRIPASWEKSAVALTRPCTASFSRGLRPKPDLHWSRAGSCANYASGTWIAVSAGQSARYPTVKYITVEQPTNLCFTMPLSKHEL
jgi:hypothetical protein